MEKTEEDWEELETLESRGERKKIESLQVLFIVEKYMYFDESGPESEEMHSPMYVFLSLDDTLQSTL